MGATDQRSQFHTTGVAGTDGAARPTAENLRSERLQTFGDGVLPSIVSNIAGALAATGGTDQVTIDKGAAFVNGEYFEVPTSTVLSIARPAATTGGHIVLRHSIAAQSTPVAGTSCSPATTSAATVRLVAVRNAAGDTSIPQLAQTPGSVWEIRIATFQVTNAGIVTVTDVREFLSKTAWHRLGGSPTDWSVPGTTRYRVPGVKLEFGMVRWTGTATFGSVFVNWPSDYSAGNPIPFVSVNGNSDILATGLIQTGGVLVISWRSVTNTTYNAVDLCWLVLGPHLAS